jgi:hypothetical protein
MNPELIAKMFWTVFGVAAVLFGVYGVLLKTLRAEFRYELFALRRRLFLVAAEGRVAPNHPAYARLRHLINNLLANAEGWSGAHMIVLALTKPPATPELAAEFHRQIRQLPDHAARREILEIHQAVIRAMARHLNRLAPISPLITALLFVIRTRAFGRQLLGKNASIRSGLVRRLQTEAEEPEVLLAA